MTGTGKGRIAFVDDDLDNYHTNLFLKLLREDCRERGFNASGCTALKEEAGKAWAKSNGVKYYADPKELDRNADFYMVLAPSTSETHLELCRRVIPHGKPVWVDKTFAPDLATAKAIFDLADSHKVPLETSSALRYTAVQERVRRLGLENIRHMAVWGAGGKMQEYLVHPLEILISCMGPEVTRIMRRGKGGEMQVLLDFSRERTGVVSVYLKTDTPFAATLTTARETSYVAVETGPLFRDALNGILDFFESGAATFDRAESCAILRVMDAALGPGPSGTWITL